MSKTATPGESKKAQRRIEAALGVPLQLRRKKPKKTDRFVQASETRIQQPLVRAPVPKGAETGVIIVDLFACVGGYSTGATQAGHTVVLAVDCDPVPLSIHAANHPECRHVEMWLGPDTEEELTSLIREVVPEGAHWHLHGSPPCTKLSSARKIARKAGEEYDPEAINSAAREGADLVEWYMEFSRRMQPTSWSMEQVNAKLVRNACDLQKKMHPQWFDYEVVEFWKFGVSQTRTRVIAGLPWMVERLRFDTTLRVGKLVTIREAVDVPEGVAYMRNCWSRPADQSLTEEGMDGDFLNEDAESRCRSIDDVGWTMMAGRPLQWWDNQYRRVRDMRINEIMALQTFPADYVMPDGVNVADQVRGVGNAVPPLFARKFMSRYKVPE